MSVNVTHATTEGLFSSKKVTPDKSKERAKQWIANECTKALEDRGGALPKASPCASLVKKAAFNDANEQTYPKLDLGVNEFKTICGNVGKKGLLRNVRDSIGGVFKSQTVYETDVCENNTLTQTIAKPIIIKIEMILEAFEDAITACMYMEVFFNYNMDRKETMYDVRLLPWVVEVQNYKIAFQNMQRLLQNEALTGKERSLYLGELNRILENIEGLGDIEMKLYTTFAKRKTELKKELNEFREKDPVFQLLLCLRNDNSQGAMVHMSDIIRSDNNELKQRAERQVPGLYLERNVRFTHQSAYRIFLKNMFNVYNDYLL
jgi:hypothetical protein